MMRRPSFQAAPLALCVLVLHLSACAAQTPSSAAAGAPLPAAAPARAQGGQGDTAAQGVGAAASAAPASSAAPSSAAAPATNPVHAPNARVGVSSAAGAPDVAAPNPAASGAAAPDAGASAAAAPGSAAAPAAPAAIVAAPAAPAAAPVVMPSSSPTGSLLQTLFAMIVVLAALAGLAWFLKRYGPKASGANANVKIVGSLNLGGRERLLVVEVGNQWIVVGASPGRVNGLATMPRQEGVDAGATLSAPAPAAANFGDWLKQTLDKRKE